MSGSECRLMLAPLFFENCTLKFVVVVIYYIWCSYCAVFFCTCQSFYFLGPSTIDREYKLKTFALSKDTSNAC